MKLFLNSALASKKSQIKLWFRFGYDIYLHWLQNAKTLNLEAFNSWKMVIPTLKTCYFEVIIKSFFELLLSHAWLILKCTFLNVIYYENQLLTQPTRNIHCLSKYLLRASTFL